MIPETALAMTVHILTRCSKCGRRVQCRLMLPRGFNRRPDSPVPYDLLCHRCRSRYRGRYVYPTEQQFLGWFVNKARL